MIRGTLLAVAILTCIMLMTTCDSGLIPVTPAYIRPDTLIEFDLVLKSRRMIIPTPVVFRGDDVTRSDIGSRNKSIAELPESIPVDDLIEISKFTRLKKARSQANINDYPIRTTVKILMFTNRIKESCTGQLVGPNLVLTAGHCVVSIHTRLVRYDSIKVITLFDDGRTLPGSKVSKAIKAYLFKTFVNKTFIHGNVIKDLALLELEDPIGSELGYVGIGIQSEVEFYRTNIFHKWSYPAVSNPIDPTEKFNGDTLYYNYGLVDTLQSKGLGLPTGLPHGGPGQSGSGYLYAQNISNFWIAGVYTNMYQHRHYKIEENEFYSLKEIIDLRHSK